MPHDELDDILFIEEEYINKGFNSGVNAGEEFGTIEGFDCGVENGYAYGMEIGFYQGFLKIFSSQYINSIESNEKSKESKLKLVEGINELIVSFIDNPDTVTLKKIRSKFKMLISNVESKQSILNYLNSLQYNTKPKEEKPLCFKGEDIDF